jgi:hypothetical protein
MSKIKPLKLSDIEEGKHYLRMIVCRNDTMFMVRFFLDKIVGRGERMYYFENEELRIESGHSMGLMENAMGNGFFNLHRVFEDSPENRATLERIVAAQTLSEYTDIIGVDKDSVRDTEEFCVAFATALKRESLI